MKLYKIILLSIVTVVLSSCGSTTNSADTSSIPTPDIGIVVQSEKYLEVTAPKGWNSFKTNESISLEIRNISGKQITSGPDFGARIFVLTGNKWIEVKNREGYEYELITLDPSENYDPLKTVTTFVRPDLPDYTVTSRIRIYVFGNLIENGQESKKVATYIDLELNP